MTPRRRLHEHITDCACFLAGATLAVAAMVVVSVLLGLAP